MQRSTNSDIFITFQQVHILWSIWSKCIFESEIDKHLTVIKDMQGIKENKCLKSCAFFSKPHFG